MAESLAHQLWKEVSVREWHDIDLSRRGRRDRLGSNHSTKALKTFQQESNVIRPAFGINHSSYTLLQVMLVVKNLPANAGDARNESLIPESGRLEMATHPSILAWKIPAHSSTMVGHSPWSHTNTSEHAPHHSYLASYRMKDSLKENKHRQWETRVSAVG